jgi:hypothetical protein
MRSPAEIMTPLGCLPAAGLSALRRFGEQAEHLDYPYIDVGGFIVPGRDPVATNKPGTEYDHHAAVERAGPEGGKQPPSEQAGPATGARKRSPEAAPGSSPHAVGHRLTTLNLDLSTLVAYHPLAGVVASTETVVYVNIPVGLFRGLPIGARLTLEVPLVPRERLSRAGQLSGVPDVRAWAVWEGGPMHGAFIVGHHQNPDRGICAHMPQDWVLGVHRLHDHVAFCVLWVAKVLHERVLGSYPGPQHCSVTVRVGRDRPDEYCGCGMRRRYRECCRETDLARSPYDRWREGYMGRAEYLAQLKRQARPSVPPQALLQLGLHFPLGPRLCSA